MKKRKVAVLFGGQSHEHPVSLMSVTSVLENMDEIYERYLVGITMDGRWYHYYGKEEKIINGDWEKDDNRDEVILSPNPFHHGFYNLTSGEIDRVDVIFPVLHGRNGEDGTIQGLCQLNGIPCVSCDMTAIAMDKEFTHIIAESYGVPMARYLVLKKNSHPDYRTVFAEVEQKLGMPCYVKPSKEGSSFGAHKATDYFSFVTCCEDAFRYDDKILVEEFIAGTEVGCGVLGEDETGLMYEVVVETEMYGYAEKYDGYKTKIYVPSKNLTAEQTEEVRKLSLIVAKALGVNVMGRVDFFLSGSRLVFNEINLIPGFTSHSLYPAMFVAAGKSYRSLISELIEMVAHD